MTNRSGAMVRLSASCVALALGMRPSLASAQEPFGTANVDTGTPTGDAPVPERDPYDWDLSDAVPAGYHVEDRVRRNVVLRGGALVVVFNAFSLFAAAGSRQEASLALPVAGPFIQMARTSSSNGLGRYMLAVDGLFQAIGAGMIVYGIAAKAHVLVRNVGPARVSFSPLSLGNGSTGFGFIGAF